MLTRSKKTLMSSKLTLQITRNKKRKKKGRSFCSSNDCTRSDHRLFGWTTSLKRTQTIQRRGESESKKLKMTWCSCKRNCCTRKSLDSSIRKRFITSAKSLTICTWKPRSLSKLRTTLTKSKSFSTCLTKSRDQNWCHNTEERRCHRKRADKWSISQLQVSKNMTASAWSI